jgi:hypothetical protein
MALFGILGACDAARAADLPPAPVAAPANPSPAWSFRFIPYGWFIALDGTQTIRGRSVKVDATFIEVVEKSDSIAALMGDFEARKGPFAALANLAWLKVGFDAGQVRSRSPAPGIVGTVGTSLGLDVELAILEAGAAYEFVRFGPVAFDVLGGVRYWYQQADLSLDVLGTADLGDLFVFGGRALAKSGSVDWLDPMVGARMRYSLAPGHELFLRGDIGGFDVGSRFSWQAIAGYGFDFATYNGMTFAGVIGYRALSVDYSQGAGRTRYEFDTILHGPVVGLSIKF